MHELLTSRAFVKTSMINHPNLDTRSLLDDSLLTFLFKTQEKIDDDNNYDNDYGDGKESFMTVAWKLQIGLLLSF